MLVQTAHIHGTSRTQYDAMLASGWFRGTGIIYRSEIVCIDDDVYSVQHIRLPIQDFSPKKKHRRLMRSNDQRFEITIGAPEVNRRKEDLYKAHTSRFKAFVHHSLSDIISVPMYDCGFEPLELCVYEDCKLIAVSYFDIGEKSCASMLCLYDMQYRDSSLGMYTMLKEIEYARSLGVTHYYPGYILDRPSSFDYKLSIGECEWMGGDRFWHNKADFVQSKSKADILREKMAAMKVMLSIAGFEAELRIYPYFTIGHIMKERDDLVKLPMFYSFEHKDSVYAVSYDLNIDSYVLFDIEEAEDLEFSQHLELSDDYRNSTAYDLRILRSNFYNRINKFEPADVFSHAHPIDHVIV